MMVILYIGYALPHCTTESVRAKFDSMFSDCVSTITEKVYDDPKNSGKKFKRFWVTIDAYRHDPTMNYVLDVIGKDGVVRVYYETTKGIPRFWKVKATVIGEPLL